jgi:hypothetical protein
MEESLNTSTVIPVSRKRRWKGSQAVSDETVMYVQYVCTTNYWPILSSERAPQDEEQSNCLAKERGGGCYRAYTNTFIAYIQQPIPRIGDPDVISEVILTWGRKRWTPPGCWNALWNSSRNRGPVNRSHSRNDTATTICWYNSRFGANAKRFSQPCTYKSKGKHGQ